MCAHKVAEAPANINIKLFLLFGFFFFTINVIVTRKGIRLKGMSLLEQNAVKHVRNGGQAD